MIRILARVTVLFGDRRNWATHLRPARDFALILASLAATVLQFTTVDDPSIAAWSGMVLAVLGSAALWWRREFPVAIACVGIGVCAASGSNVVMLIALCSLAIRRRDLLLVGLAACGAVVDATSTYFRTSDQGYPAVLAATSFVVAAFVVFGAYLGVRRQYLDGLHERVRQAEAEREARAEQARSEERSRIARDMHDVVAHKVSLIALHAGVLQMTRDPDTDQVHRAAELIADSARDALADLRGVLGVLGQDAPDGSDPQAPQPLLVDIPKLIDETRRVGVHVVATITADLGSPTPSAVAHAAYRVVQEALTNVHKHASGAAVTIDITGRPGENLTIEVVNTAPHAAPAIHLLVGTGAGLDGLRTRVAFARGTLECGPTETGGFRVLARMPWAAGQPILPNN